MKVYPKIKTVFKRDPETKFKTVLDNEYSIPEFEYLKNNEWVFTEKVDGTNIRVSYSISELGENIAFRGKSDKAEIPIFLLKKLEKIFLPLKSKFSDLFPASILMAHDTDICLYGEGYGAKIQKGGGNYRSDQGFVLFDIKIGQWWLKREDLENIANKLDIEIVPIVGNGNLEEMVRYVKNGFVSRWGNFPAEGIVAHPKIELVARNGQRIITKLKHKDYQKANRRIR